MLRRLVWLTRRIFRCIERGSRNCFSPGQSSAGGLITWACPLLWPGSAANILDGIPSWAWIRWYPGTERVRGLHNCEVPVTRACDTASVGHPLPQGIPVHRMYSLCVCGGQVIPWIQIRWLVEWLLLSRRQKISVPSHQLYILRWTATTVWYWSSIHLTSEKRQWSPGRPQWQSRWYVPVINGTCEQTNKSSICQHWRLVVVRVAVVVDDDDVVVVAGWLWWGGSVGRTASRPGSYCGCSIRIC